MRHVMHKLQIQLGGEGIQNKHRVENVLIPVATIVAERDGCAPKLFRLC